MYVYFSEKKHIDGNLMSWPAFLNLHVYMFFLQYLVNDVIAD